MNFDSYSTAYLPESQEEHQIKVHAFNPYVAKACGVNAAVILYSFRFWIEQNITHKRNFRDGHYWTYQTLNDLCGTFWYLTPKQIRTAIDRLEQGGYILKGNYNKSSYDHTTWYTITEAGYALFGDDSTS